uniref:Ig-like domain-containing protein n=1 Tax=Seriola dumerili TaxID=41447 RepID=A0A3B4TG33_SERDU
AKLTQHHCFYCSLKLMQIFEPVHERFRSGDEKAQYLICSHQPIVALTGDNVILPCCLEPAISAGTVEWTKPGLDPTNIHVHQDGRLEHRTQNPSYNYRTRLVKLSDEGKYRCYIPAVQKDAFVQLVVGSVSSPVVKATNSTFSGVVLHCESKGWYPEPELLWLDGEGKLLSAGPTETVRGPDDLYTVSSRVTVEKRHSNNFTCRVQQKIINQTRETQIHEYFILFVLLFCLAAFLFHCFECYVTTIPWWHVYVDHMIRCLTDFMTFC